MILEVLGLKFPQQEFVAAVLQALFRTLHLQEILLGAGAI